MKTVDLEGLYAVYDSANDSLLRFSKVGDVMLFGHYMEAEEWCSENESPIHCVDLAPAWRQIVTEQIEAEILWKEFINKQTI